MVDTAVHGDYGGDAGGDQERAGGGEGSGGIDAGVGSAGAFAGGQDYELGAGAQLLEARGRDPAP